jgi:hypothetical protein
MLQRGRELCLHFQGYILKTRTEVKSSLVRNKHVWENTIEVDSYEMRSEGLEWVQLA